MARDATFGKLATGIRRGPWSTLRRKATVAWFEVFAGEKAFKAFNEWLPE